MVKIVLDAGHGGQDSGAVGVGGLMEKNVCLDLAHRVNEKLGQFEGVSVTLTRAKDVYPSLQERAEIANNAGADLFLSLHNNSGPESAGGFESYASANCSSTTRKYQEILHKAVYAYLAKFGIKDRGMKNDTQGAHSRIYVLRATKMPAILLENLFITNPKENQLLRDPKFLDGLAEAIAGGIAAIFGLKKKGGQAPQPQNKPQAPMVHLNVNGKRVLDTVQKDLILQRIKEELGKGFNFIEVKKLP